MARDVVEYIVRQDPILPTNDVGHGRIDACKGMEPTDAHFVEDEYRREGCIAIGNVKGDSFTMELLKLGMLGVVDEHKLANLVLMNTWLQLQRRNQTHVGNETYEEQILVKTAVVDGTHTQTIAWFVSGVIFGLPRDPSAVFEIGPLCLILASGGVRRFSDLRYVALSP